MATKEKTDLQTTIRKFLFFSVFFAILLLFVEMISGHFFQKTILKDDVTDISVTRTNGSEVTSLTIGKMLPYPLRRGDILTCSITCSDCDLSYPALVLESIRGDITVTNNGKTLYSSTSGDASSKMVNQISLSNADFSKPITVTITASEPNSIFFVPMFILTEQRNGFSQFLQSRSISFVIAVFLFIIGIIGTVICTTSRFLGKKLLPLIHISQFTLWTSVCMLCHLGSIQLFIHNETVNTVLEILSFYLSFISVGLIIYPQLITTKKSRRIYIHVTAGFIVYCVLSLLLPVFTSIHFLDTYLLTIGLLIIGLLYTIFCCTKQWKTQPEKMSLPVAGFFVFITYALLEQIRIILFSAGIHMFATPEVIILSFGIIIFTACSLTDYFLWFKAATIQETVEDSWKRFTEPNSEPGISGYQKTLALLHELQDSQSQYTIITISIDNIDELKLSETPYPLLEDNFARLMYLVFSSYGITGNLGGGKFLAALPDMPEGKVKQLLSAFKALVNRDNESHPEAKIVFSFGYALSSDSDSSEIVKICQLANNSRMVQEQQLLQ